MPRLSPRPFVALAFAAALTPALPGFARAETAPQAEAAAQAPVTDAASATAVVEEAAARLAALHASQRALPDRPVALQRSQAQFEEDLKALQQAVSRLASKLAGGATVEETQPLVRRIRTLSRSTRDAAMRAQFPANDLAPLEEGLASLARLDGLYGGGTLPAAPAPQ